MKKILFVFALSIGFAVAANAQSNASATDNSSDPVKVEVAGQTNTQGPVATQAENDTPSAKSCCSSKNGKATASANAKSCCKDGKKSKAHCADMKE